VLQPLLLVLQLHLQPSPPGNHLLRLHARLVDLIDLRQDLLALDVAGQHLALHGADALDHGQVLLLLLLVGAGVGSLVLLAGRGGHPAGHLHLLLLLQLLHHFLGLLQLVLLATDLL
jgi:hypothetical protein